METLSARVRELVHRLAGAFRRGRSDADLEEELRAHLEMASGATARDADNAGAASRLAVLRHGGLTQTLEAQRDQRSLVWLDQLRQDLRHALRALFHRPGFSAVAVAAVAIGVSASIAVFSLFDAFVLRPLPVKNPGELVLLGWHQTAPQGGPRKDYADYGGGDGVDVASGHIIRRPFSWPAFEQFRTADTPLAELVAVGRLWQPTLTLDGHPEQLEAADIVSANYHASLGVGAHLGRTLRPDDDRPGAAPVIVISHHYWQRRFGADPRVIGRTAQLNRVPVTIVGVTAPGFFGVMLSTVAQVTVPLALAERVMPDPDGPLHDPEFWWLAIMGRLKPGATIAQVTASLDGPFRALAQEAWSDPKALPILLASAGGYGQTEDKRRENAGAVVPLAAMAALLLLVACANLANLLLARGAERRRELALRLALGARRGRVIRHLFAESALLAFAGSIVGILLAAWGVHILVAVLNSETDQALLTFDLNWRIAGFSVLLAGFTAMLFGLLPALRATRLDLTTEFQGGTRAPGGSRSKLSRILMVAQMSLSLALLVLAGLLGRTVQNLVAVDIGFNRERLLLFSLEGHIGQPKFNELYERVRERLQHTPGVERVTYSGGTNLTFAGGTSTTFEMPGGTASKNDRLSTVWSQVDPRFFETLGVPFQAGYGFSMLDQAASLHVVVVNQAFARKFFPNISPLGHRLRFLRPQRGQREAEIIGIVRDFRQGTGPRAAAEPAIFTPASAAAARPRVDFMVRTIGPPETMAGEIRKAVTDVNPDVPLVNVRTQLQDVDQALTEERLYVRLSAFLGAAAVVLACVGLYGLMAFAVRRRTSEIGLRMALGASPSSIRGMILSDVFMLALAGAVVGIVVAGAATRLISRVLYGLSPTDPLTFGIATAFLTALALGAGWLPARRAARLNPTVALRQE